MIRRLIFNISASSLQLYKKSPLQFYYQYIQKANPDTYTIQCYSDAGNAVHELLQKFVNDEIWSIELQFKQLWEKKKLHIQKSLNGKPLDYDKYFQSVLNGIKKLETIYNNKRIAEEKFLYPFIDDKYALVNLKGFIDLQYFDENNNLILVDWKTSSQVTEGEFDIQAKMYYLFAYRKYHKLPKKIVYEYLKINKTKIYTFTLDEIKKFEKEISVIVKDILFKSNDVGNFEAGDWDNIFNPHRIKCEREVFKRNKKFIITATINNNKIIFDTTLPNIFKKLFRKKYSYKVMGCEHSDLYKKHLWDGIKSLYKYNTLPIGFINNVKKLIDDYNNYHNTNYKLKIYDNRDRNVLLTKFDTKFKKTNKKLRDYQKDAIDKILNEKIGIIYLGTGLGKTFVAANIIKIINKRTLFIVNRIELVEQTVEILSNELGIDIGKMSEGNLVVDKQITVASVQTIYSILKKKNNDSKILNNYLYNVNVTIWDEAQNVGNHTNYYSMLQKRLVNSEYIIGLTGSPFRNDGTTLEMNAIVGFPVVEYTTEWGEKNGWLCPTKCFFIKMPKTEVLNDNYADVYNEMIVNNNYRNNLIKNITENFLKYNKKIIILVKIIKHGELLQKLIPNSKLINSKININKRKKIMEDYRNNKFNVLIVGVKIAGQGLDLPNLDVIIIASAHKSDVDSVQIIGRVKRLFPNKKYGYLIDFYDYSYYFRKASNERINILKEFGNNIQIIDKIDNIIIQ